jgi:hypothetical protein
MKQITVTLSGFSAAAAQSSDRTKDKKKMSYVLVGKLIKALLFSVH